MTVPLFRLVPKRARRGNPSGYRFKQYNVSASELEEKLKDLVLEQRESDGYAEEVMALLNEKAEFGRRAAAGIGEFRRKIEDLEKQHRATVKLQLQAASRGLETDSYFEEIEVIEQQRSAAEGDLAEALEYARSRELARERVAALLDEKSDLADAWNAASLEERRMLLDWWVLDVMIVVEPIPGMKRANNKTALVALRGHRDALQHFALGNHRRRASLSSSATNNSSSTSNRSDNTARASSEPMRPRAQAAWPRTNGSGSASARASTGTAAGDPQLPSPTQMLRATPERPALRNGEPRENDSQAASPSAVSSSSISDGEAVPGWGMSEASGSTLSGGSSGLRAAYDGSDDVAENLRVKGHASWLVYPLTRFKIPLMTGRRSVSKKTS